MNKKDKRRFQRAVKAAMWTDEDIKNFQDILRKGSAHTDRTQYTRKHKHVRYQEDE